MPGVTHMNDTSNASQDKMANVASPTDTQIQIPSRYQVGEELILSVVLDSRNIGEIFAITQANGIFVELDSLINVLEFPIEANPSSGQYSGWYIRQENEFTLEIANMRSPTLLSFDNKTIQPLNDQLIVLQDIVYLHTDLIYRVFKIATSLDFTKQQITLKPNITLPIQERLNRRNKDVMGRKADNEAKYPELFRGYEILSPQTLDFSTNLNYSENTKDIQGNYSVLGRREIAYLSTRFFLGGNKNEALDNARLNFSKQNINSPFMDALGVSRFEFGDVTPLALGGSSLGGQAMGLTFTNVKRSRSSNQQNISIAGEVLNNWDVELYRNDILVGQFFDITDGRYEFNDIQLFVGENRFEVIKYGPQGEIETEIVTRYLSANEVDDQGWTYRASITQPNTTLLGKDNLSNLSGQDRIDLVFSSQRHIASGNSLRLGFKSDLRDLSAKPVLYAGIGGRIGERLFYGLDLIDSATSQTASLALNTVLFGQQTNLNVGFLKQKTNAEFSDSFLPSATLTMAGNLSLGSTTRLSYENTLRFIETNSLQRVDFTNSFGLLSRYGNFYHSINHEVESSTRANDDTKTKNTTGSFSYTKRFWKIHTRLNASYQIDDETKTSEFDSYGFELNYRHNKKLWASYKADFQQTNDILFQRFNVNWNYRSSILSANLGHSDLLGFSAGVNARFSMGGEPFNTDVFYNHMALTNNGTLVVRVFLDSNLNGTFDEGEELIKDAKVISKQSRATDITDQEGFAILKQLSTIDTTDITVDASESGNPFLTPLLEGVSIQPRQGFIDKLDFPMVETSEIEGVVNTQSENKNSIAYLTINLLDEKGKTVLSTKSEFDGYFFFADVKPGRYNVDVSSEQLDKRRMKFAGSDLIDIAGSSEIYIIEDVIIEPIPYETVYYASIGEFSDLNMLKSYSNLLKLKINNKAVYDLSYLSLESTNKYQLVSQKFKSEKQAFAKCRQFNQLKLNCQVTEIELPSSLFN